VFFSPHTHPTPHITTHTNKHPTQTTTPTTAALLSQHLAATAATANTAPQPLLQATEGLQLFVPGNGAGVFPGSTSGANPGLSVIVDREVPSALLYTDAGDREAEEEKEEEEEDDEKDVQALATEAKRGGAYTLVLDNFPPAQLLSLILTPPTGAGKLLGLVPSSSSAAAAASKAVKGGGGGVRWRWTVPQGTPVGEYFIEVTSQRQDAFAYSQAFRIV
jgi:hypothetical protein